MLLLLILEVLQLLDIATTEYAISKKLGTEINPLMRNNKIRRGYYTAKLSIPFILEWVNRIVVKYYPNYLYLSSIIKGIFITFIGFQSVIGINNLRVIIQNLIVK